MYTEVHSRKSNENNNGYKQNARPIFLCASGKTAKRASRILRVAAGEGIARCGRLCRFNRVKIRVKHPRSGNTENELKRLIDYNTAESYAEKVVAAMLAEAPENRESHGEKCDLVAKVRKRTHNGIKNGISYAFKKIKKLHKAPLFYNLYIL
jgi:hypothetical protein